MGEPDPGNAAGSAQGIPVGIRVDLARQRSNAQHSQRVLAVIGKHEAVDARDQEMQWRNPGGNLRREPEEDDDETRECELAES